MDTIQDTLLSAALPHIAFDGWTMATFERAARDMGLAAAEAQRAFPGGGRWMLLKPTLKGQMRACLNGYEANIRFQP